MQQFQVPQFITVEDRIIGPLTLKQFLYLLGGAGVAVLGWSFLHIVLFVLVALPLIGLFVAMAFVKISERPLPVIFLAAINYYLRPRLYLWHQSHEKKNAVAAKKEEVSLLAAIPKLSGSKLNDLAWSLDIKERTAERQ
ncbi:MAG: PrgI family protein [bacterium]|nr:PrgI family protein [bacterium]